VSTFDRIEAGMPRLLSELADARTPDYFEVVVSRTAGSPQRPGWTFPERWLPVSVTTFDRMMRSTVPWRTIGAIVLLVLALVGGALILAGSRQRPLPAPFGPALPGLVVYESGGDLYTADPATGVSTPLLTGPTADTQPRWSPDGTRVAFQREVDAGFSSLHVIDPQTGAVTTVSSSPLGLVSSFVFSPDGRRLVASSSRTGTDVITIFDLGGGTSAEITAEGGASHPAFKPPDGSQIMFVAGLAESEQGQGLSVYDLATGRIETIVDRIPRSIINGGPEYSPDGTRIAYGLWIPAQDVMSRVYTANADGTDIKVLGYPGDSCCEAMPAWSNDGTRLAVSRWDLAGRRLIAIVPWDKGGAGMEYEIPTLYRGVAAWSPDDRWVLVTPMTSEDPNLRAPQVLLDVETGKAKPIQWVTESDPSVQRLAP
jgi:Tol biopolymer transport system component